MNHFDVMFKSKEMGDYPQITFTHAQYVPVSLVKANFQRFVHPN